MSLTCWLTIGNQQVKTEPTRSASEEEPKPTKPNRFDQMNQMNRTNTFTALDLFNLQKTISLPRPSICQNWLGNGDPFDSNDFMSEFQDFGQQVLEHMNYQLPPAKWR